MKMSLALSMAAAGGVDRNPDQQAHVQHWSAGERASSFRKGKSCCATLQETFTRGF